MVCHAHRKGRTEAYNFLKQFVLEQMRVPDWQHYPMNDLRKITPPPPPPQLYLPSRSGPVPSGIILRGKSEADAAAALFPIRYMTLPTSARRIFLIEDNAKTAHAVCDGLESEAYATARSSTGEDGFYRLNAAAFDFVLLDCYRDVTGPKYAKRCVLAA